MRRLYNGSGSFNRREGKGNAPAPVLGKPATSPYLVQNQKERGGGVEGGLWGSVPPLGASPYVEVSNRARGEDETSAEELITGRRNRGRDLKEQTRRR